MKILKRNQLIILVMSLMLITAGYLNFTSNNNNLTTSTISARDDMTIGDAELVSTIPKEENANNIIDNNQDFEGTNLEVKEENNLNNIVPTNTKNEKEDYYFTSSKLERSAMYSESLESYQEIYNNPNSTAESKQEALSKINGINNTKNAIMIAENLIIAKGFENVVIFVNDGSVSVIIKASELKEEQVAQIQNIVSRELNVSGDIIHISNKNI